MNKVKVEVSARHCHLTQAHIEKLFGQGYQLKPLKMLSQPGQYASEEEIIVRGPKNEFKVRVLGPARPYSQVEIAVTDCYKIGVVPALRDSGYFSGSPGALLIGPKGQVEIKEGVIVSQRHIHLNPNQAKKIGLKNRQKVSVRVGDLRAVTFHNVTVRIHEKFDLRMHLDTDEGNACGYFDGMIGQILKA